MLAVVNPAFGGNLTNSTGHPFAPLTEWQSHIKDVTQFYQKEKILQGVHATRKKVLAEAPSYDVVLFGTHAKAVEEEPMKSYVALADSLLRVGDIARAQRLNARLVILAACETGLGRVTGDGAEGGIKRNKHLVLNAEFRNPNSQFPMP